MDCLDNFVVLFLFLLLRLADLTDIVFDLFSVIHHYLNWVTKLLLLIAFLFID